MTKPVLIHEDVKVAWVAYEKANGATISRVKCERCYYYWWIGGKNGEAPPVWPPDYAGKNCPICNQRFPDRASIPF